MSRSKWCRANKHMVGAQAPSEKKCEQLVGWRWTGSRSRRGCLRVQRLASALGRLRLLSWLARPPLPLPAKLFSWDNCPAPHTTLSTLQTLFALSVQPNRETLSLCLFYGSASQGLGGVSGFESSVARGRVKI